ncbi:hypothetical protein ACN28E_00180 [Archangium lansingense]|uniref:hypothetical protein n=1 Tax=Archangium lansingense TaxID=2995310 RepID=UPI003B7919F0
MRISSLLAFLPRWLALGLSLFGVQALADYTNVPDGYVLLSIEHGHRYMVAGGAKFYIPPAQLSAFPGGTTVALPQATIDSVTTIPRDGTLIRSYNANEIYVVVGNMFWWIPNPTELSYWDDWRIVNVIPNRWDPAFYNYSNTILVQERSTSQVYLWIAGARFPITNEADLNYFGGYANVKTIPLGTLASITYQAWCGVNLRERSSSTVYTVGYGSSTSATMRRGVTTLPADGVVPDGALSVFPLTSGTPACIW